MQVCIVTGLSGAGKSTVLQAFEDLEHLTVDGLPAGLAADMTNMMKLHPMMTHFKGIALGMDMRQSNFLVEINDALSAMTRQGVRPLLIFLEAQIQELIRRYATTRRPHPLERNGIGLEAALARERESLNSLRELADIVIDTTKFSVHDLRRAIQKRWSGGRGALRALRVNVISFGFKYGVPREADFVFDLRFLPNPYFVEELRPLCGKDKAVSDYIFSGEKTPEFRKKFMEFLQCILPMMEAEGRHRVAIALGCTGGRHRSVAVAEETAQALRQAAYPVTLEHRHLELG